MNYDYMIPMNLMSNISKQMERNFLDKSFQVTTWEALKPYFDELLDRKISNKEELSQWFKDRSELESVV